MTSPELSSLHGPTDAGASQVSGRWWPWLLLAAGLVVFRCLPYVVWGTLAFDADQALVGLMAKHVAEFRALPVYQYGLPYVVIVSAYVTAPFIWLLGATPLALKLPVLLINVGVGVAVVWAMVRAGVRPAAATLLALPVILPSAVSNAGLMDALGMTVEPAAFVLALWFTRRSPVLFGVIAAVGFHVREFVAYGVAAIVAVDVLSGWLISREGSRHWRRATVTAAAAAALIAGLARFGSVRGPGTWLTSEVEGNLSTLGAAFCFVPQQAWRNVLELGVSYLGLLWGPTPAPLSSAAVQSGVRQGLAGAWPLLGVVLLAAALHLGWHWKRLWRGRHDPALQLAAVMTLVGLQAVLVYAISRCGPVSVVTIRYALLGVFLPSGLALGVWLTGPSRALRSVLGTAFIALAALNAWPHARLWQEQWTHPSVSSRALLGAAMESRGLRYARSDYWTAYYVTFLTQERVIVGAETLSRVDAYERALAQHADEVVRIATTPCDSSPPIVAGFYVCSEHGR
jgi:hypothetical protein